MARITRRQNNRPGCYTNSVYKQPESDSVGRTAVRPYHTQSIPSLSGIGVSCYVGTEVTSEYNISSTNPNIMATERPKKMRR